MLNVLTRYSTASFLREALCPTLAEQEIDQRPASDSDVLTVGEAAAAAKVDPKTIRRLIKSGRLRATPYGSGTQRKNYRIRRGDLALVADAETPAGASENVMPQLRRRRLTASSAADFLPRVA